MTQEKARRDRGLPQSSNKITISSPVGNVISKLEGVHGGNGSWTAKCPSHDDHRNSLSISEGSDGKILLKCHANHGCTAESIAAAMGLEMKDLFPVPDNGQPKKQKKEIVATYDYHDESGQMLYQAVRYRPKDFRQRRPDGTGGWTWNLKGTRRVLYRLPQVIAAVAAGQTIYVVEGEKDVVAIEELGLVATCNCGGAGKWREDYSEALRGAQVIIVPDNDDPGRKHAEAVKDALAGIAASVKVIHLPGLPEKGDVSDWIAGGGTAEELQGLVSDPPLPPVTGLAGWQAPSNPLPEREATDNPPSGQQVGSRLSAAAKRVIEAADPLELVGDAIKAMGYGGDVRTVLIIYLAATSRLLAMRRGSLPVHLLVKGAASAGKSYAIKIVTGLLPGCAVFEIDAGSPRVLIYTKAEFKHRVMIFSEADSLPAGEDNPAASAVRNLLQDHQLNYQVVETKGNRQTVRSIRKQGPTVLITTATRSLGHQLMSRLFVLEVPDDQNQIRAALDSQAGLELHGGKEPEEALIAFQELLQHEAPFNVLVPFADKLSVAIGRRPQAARILRDYARLLSLIGRLGTYLRN